MTQDRSPWRLKEMTPVAVRERLHVRPTLIVPIGTTEQHGPHLPLGCDTLILERLAELPAPPRWSTGYMPPPGRSLEAPPCGGARFTV